MQAIVNHNHSCKAQMKKPLSFGEALIDFSKGIRKQISHLEEVCVRRC